MKKYVLKTVSYILVAALAAMLTLYVDNRMQETDKLDQLVELIGDRFIGESDLTAMEDGAAEGIIDSLGDRWSYYIPASEYQSYQEQMNNAYVGVGVTIMLREDGTGIDITKVTAGGPAEKAGILVGDILIAADGQSVLVDGLDQTQELVRGEKGTTVSLTVLRDGQELTFEVVRDEIQSVVAEATMLEDGIGLVSIYNFDARCADESIAAIETLLAEGATSLIFDVRYNPGGYKHELVELLDYLLPEGKLFCAEDYTGKVEIDYSDADCLDIPMAVLVNGSSYSAAEFFAAALSEYDAAIIVGEQTSGKGYFQNTFQLGDGSAVALSTGKYTTPNGISLEGVGITPDVIVEVDEETAAKIYAEQLDPAEDPQILAAINALKSGK